MTNNSTTNNQSFVAPLRGATKEKNSSQNKTTPDHSETRTPLVGAGGPRIQSFDLARGFTVLMMPMIHTVMLCSTTQVQQSLLGDILGFIAEGPGAQLFMLLMGVNFALKQSGTSSPFGGGREEAALANSSMMDSKQSCSTGPCGTGRTKGTFFPWTSSNPGRLGNDAMRALKRSALLFLAAYLLNIFKFLIPLGLGLMPENLLTELNMTNDLQAAKFFFLIGDILQFAAIANLILFLLTRTRHYAIIAIAMAIAIIFLSPVLWDLKTGTGWLDHIVVLFNGHPPQSFFPVLPWMVYPLIGLTLGYLLKTNNHNYIIKKAGLSGIGLVVISLVLPATTVTVEWLPFYRTEPADTIFHLGFVLAWLALFQWLSKSPSLRGGFRGRPVFKLLTFCSRNITAIYLIQWVLICWLMCFTGYLTQSFWPTIGWMTAVTTITLLLTYKLNHK